jgi:lipoyl(octanoyl) transferase
MTDAEEGAARARPFPGLARIDLGEVPYEEAAEAMRGWVTECQSGAEGDRLFLLSHSPVVTYGARTEAGDLPGAGTGLPGLPVVAVDRGGLATYHGPGQVVGYLVANVRERGPADIVRWMELGIVEALTSLGFEVLRRDTEKDGPNLVGVWTPDNRKVASIGMRIRGGVSSHGFSVNVDPDMSVFSTFVSCGFGDVDPMTSLKVIADERGLRLPSEAEVRDALAKALHAA